VAKRLTETIHIIELDKNDVKPLGTAKELRAAILSLDGHLGFQEMLRRLRVAKSLLRSQLENGEYESLAGVQRIQALVQAYSFLERQLKTELGRPVEKEREPFAEEAQEFERIKQFIEVVGQ